MKTKRQYYGSRMDKVGMDPDERVTLTMLGQPLANATLHEDVRVLVAELDARFPPGWVAP